MVAGRRPRLPRGLERLRELVRVLERAPPVARLPVRAAAPEPGLERVLEAQEPVPLALGRLRLVLLLPR